MNTSDYIKYFTSVQNGNDVRGAAIATETEKLTLSEGIVTFIARAFVKFLTEKCQKSPEALRIGIGHDSRITAEKIKIACLKGVSTAQAFDCGQITTPAMFQSTVLPKSNFDGAIMITASHLPFNRNGMKFFTKEGAISKAELSSILETAISFAEQYAREDGEALLTADALPAGSIPAQSFDMRTVYCDHMKQIICREVNSVDYDHPLTGLHIVEDAGNGAAGFFATEILAPLGADISGSVFLDPDGTFPNHVPNP